MDVDVLLAVMKTSTRWIQHVSANCVFFSLIRGWYFQFPPAPVISGGR